MKEINLIRQCPVCGNLRGNVIHNQSFILPSDSPLPDFYNIVFCQQCGFVFADTPANQKTYNEYYQLLSKYEDLTTGTGGGLNQFDQVRLLATAKVIQKYLPDYNAKILDIGCANGGLLRILKTLNYSEVMGIDPSIVCSNYVQSIGIRCLAGDLFSDSFEQLSETFDFIILTHVIEHLYDLQLSVQKISSKLIDNGMIYIEVPDASRYSDYYMVPYYYIDCEHINHFDENSLFNLFTSNGFIQLETRNIELSVTGTNKYPAVYSVFQKAKKQTNTTLTFSEISKNSFIKFLDQSKTYDENDALIQQLIETQEPVLIWGAGQFTLRLLANSALGKCNIQGFLDSDSNKHGKILSGFPINSPEFLRTSSNSVIICSALHYEEIIKIAGSLNSSTPIYILK